MTDYHFGPLFRFIPTETLYKLGLLKLGDGITGTIEATMSSDLSTAPVTTSDVFAAHNQQNNWWYTGDGDLIVWSNRFDAPSGYPFFYFRDFQIQDFSTGIPLAAGAVGDYFYYLADASGLLDLYFVDLSDLSNQDPDGSFVPSDLMAELDIGSFELIIFNPTGLEFHTLSGAPASNQRFLTPAFNADCTELKIGIGPDLDMLGGTTGDLEWGATCATLTIAGPTTINVALSTLPGIAWYDDTTGVSITQTPRADNYNPSVSINVHAYRQRSTHYNIGDKVHAGENAAIPGSTPHTWQALTAGTTAAGSAGIWPPGVDNLGDGGVDWDYIGTEYLPFDPDAGVTDVAHASDECISPTHTATPTEYGTLESLIATILADSTADYSHAVEAGPTDFAVTYYSGLNADHDYSPIAGVDMTGIDPAFRRRVSIRKDFTNGDPSTFTTLESFRTMFTYVGTVAVNAPAALDGSLGYTGVIPVGWVLDRADNLVKAIDLRQSQALTYSGSAIGETGRHGLFGYADGVVGGGSYMIADALAEFANALSADGSYTVTQTVASPHRSGLAIGGTVQAELSDLYAPSGFGGGSTMQDGEFSHHVETNTGERTYAAQTGLSPTTLTNTSDGTLAYKMHRQDILGWNFAGKAFYVEKWEDAAALELESETSINHTADYRVNGASVHSRSFLWGDGADTANYFSLHNGGTFGFAYCYIQPIAIGGNILFSTCHAFSWPGNYGPGFGVGSTANADQFNWLIASDGSIVSTVNLQSGSVAINPAFNDDSDLQHIALGYTWGL